MTPFRLSAETPVLFLDDELIGRQQRVTRRWLAASVADDPAIVADRPWETRTLAFPSIVTVPGGYRIYYTDFERPPGRHKLMIAESGDGFRWSKPMLGLHPWDGSADNNIVLATDRIFDSPSVVCSVGQVEPWRMLVCEGGDLRDRWAPDWGLYSYRSSDGRAWSLDPAAFLRAGDRNSVVDRGGGRGYVAYDRHARMLDDLDTRAVYRSTSTDFRAWTEPELVLAPDLADDHDVEFYGLTAFERHGWWFGLLEVWHHATDTFEIELVFSRDGRQWQRGARGHAFIAPTSRWNTRWTTAASGGPIVIRDQLVFYLNGRTVAHTFDAANQHGAIGYASLPLDRFCAIEGHHRGLLETVPLTWPGGELALNVDTRHTFTSHPAELDGVLRVELLTHDGTPLPGWSGPDAAVVREDTVARGEVRDGIVRWPSGGRMDQLAGQALRLRFHLDGARLFSLAAGRGR